MVRANSREDVGLPPTSGKTWNAYRVNAALIPVQLPKATSKSHLVNYYMLLPKDVVSFSCYLRLGYGPSSGIGIKIAAYTNLGRRVCPMFVTDCVFRAKRTTDDHGRRKRGCTPAGNSSNIQ